MKCINIYFVSVLKPDGINYEEHNGLLLVLLSFTSQNNIGCTVIANEAASADY